MIALLCYSYLSVKQLLISYSIVDCYPEFDVKCPLD